MLHLRRASVRPASRRTAAVVAVLALTAGALLGAPAAASATPQPPPNPTDGQLSAAAAAKAAASARVTQSAAQVGIYNGRVAAAQAELTRLQGTEELAEQKVAYAVSEQRASESRAASKIAENKTAVANVAANNANRVREVQAIYMGGQSSDGATAALLQAKNPSALLNQSTLDNFIVQNKMDAIGRSQRLAVVASNSAAAARLAVQQRKAATAGAKAAQRAAAAQASLQAARKSSLESTLAASQAELATKQSEFSAAQADYVRKTGERAAYVRYQAYLAEQRRIAAAKAAAAAKARRLAAAAEAAKKAAEAARKHHRGGGGGGGGDGGGSSYTPPVHAVGGSWTAARGRAAVARAMTTIGTPYAWAGGGTGGPSYGVCDASNGAPNDCYVRGYDCSGLAMYSWGPYLTMPHYAAAQYNQAGSYHPPLSKLKPGDLLFWSNGGVGGIHHVAIYKGNGLIIQAPYSGGYVEVSSMYDPGQIFGATRPLT